MTDSLSSISDKSGMPPGSLVHVGEVHANQSRITLLSYNKEKFEELAVESISEIIQYRSSQAVTWVNVEGLSNVEVIESIGNLFDVHPLVLEDILNTHQRPKFEDYENYLYIVLKGLIPEQTSFAINSEQISILIFDNFVFTFKEKVDDMFLPVIQRIKNGKGRFRSLGADYMAHAILDIIVDQNFSIMDSLSETIDAIEEEILTNPTANSLKTMQSVKREIIYMRRYVSPLRELLAALMRSDSRLVQEHTLIYYRDVLDHVLRVSESLDSYRDILSNLLDVYNSSISNKMNEVMKVLTVFASIFIPLTFIVGIYGMNFEYMPELKWRWAYPALWISFVVITVSLLMYFRKKKWL
ncbi:MAG TPA: magnesium/cobalt transporter CorA [Gammaproteobacteria bacterium]|nr:magnesium/cobalt transporter CorA [Gammaproteobacteria bacterium]